MAFCKNCGQQIPDGAQACVNCGTPVEPVSNQPVDYTPAVNEQVNTAGASGEFNNEKDVNDNKGISILSYFGILLLIPLFVKKDSEYCKFHVKQGANLFVIDIAYAIVTQILLAVIGLIFRPTIHSYYMLTYAAPHPVYSLFNVVFSLGYIFFVVIAIIGMVNAGTGKRKPMPVLGGIKIMDSVMDKIYDSLNK